ncbi:MAG: inositol monophosphatase family protein [Janthinobacterium lividum]
MSALDARLAAAGDLAARAGALAMRMRPPAGAAQATLKGAQDWLTEADGAVEQMLSDALLSAFPGDGFQGEEGGATRAGTLRWVVDPIDGTSNYARGAPRWCVSLGLLDGNMPVLGVLAAPALGETFAAAQGCGATLNGAPIRAAETSSLSRAIIEAGWSPRVKLADYQALCARLQAEGVMLRNGGSGALGLADVAAGRIDGYSELHINLWDCAAALAVLAEAGAVTASFLPRGLQGGAPILAAAPGVAAALAAASRLP